MPQVYVVGQVMGASRLLPVVSAGSLTGGGLPGSDTQVVPST